MVLQPCLRGTWHLQIPGLHKRTYKVLTHSRVCIALLLLSFGRPNSFPHPPTRATSTSVPLLLSEMGFSRSVTRAVLASPSCSLPARCLPCGSGSASQSLQRRGVKVEDSCQRSDFSAAFVKVDRTPPPETVLPSSPDAMATLVS